jgi:hypothetical protein
MCDAGRLIGAGVISAFHFSEVTANDLFSLFIYIVPRVRRKQVLKFNDIFFIVQADRAYGTEVSPSSFVISFVILLYAISYNICI